MPSPFSCSLGSRKTCAIQRSDDLITRRLIRMLDRHGFSSRINFHLTHALQFVESLSYGARAPSADDRWHGQCRLLCVHFPFFSVLVLHWARHDAGGFRQFASPLLNCADNHKSCSRVQSQEENYAARLSDIRGRGRRVFRASQPSKNTGSPRYHQVARRFTKKRPERKLEERQFHPPGEHDQRVADQWHP